MLTDDLDVVFIGEFRYLPNASMIFKAIYDGGSKAKIVATGSSSTEIHKHLKESLATDLPPNGWPHYGDHKMAPLRRSSSGPITAIKGAA